VAPPKPEDFAVKIVEHFGLARYFEAVCGAAMDESRTEKAQVLRYALDRLGISPEACLMVGDREHDVLGAREAASIPCLGVLWGYGSREELAAAGALALVRTPEEMTAWILQ
jgi:phosphoglycolate phosphatase